MLRKKVPVSVNCYQKHKFKLAIEIVFQETEMLYTIGYNNLKGRMYVKTVCLQKVKYHFDEKQLLQKFERTT